MASFGIQVGKFCDLAGAPTVPMLFASLHCSLL